MHALSEANGSLIPSSNCLNIVQNVEFRRYRTRRRSRALPHLVDNPDMSIAGPILITGGAGMLAHAFRETCNSRGIESHLVTRADCDITNVAQILTVMDQYNPSTVINCAAYTKVDLAEKEKDAALTINGKAVGFVAEACRRRSLTLVHFSTDYVFDGSIRRPLRPADPLKPKSMYGISKLLGEQMLQEFAPPRWLILRTAWLYGPDGHNFL